MPITLNNIDINCKEGLAIAAELTAAAEKLRNCHSAGIAILSDLQGAWTGSCASTYIARATETLEGVSKQASNLDEIAGAIRETVAVYRQQQMDLYNKQQKEMSKRKSKH